MRFASVRIVALLSVVTVLLLALTPAASAQSAGWQPGPGAILDNTYTGFIDVPTNGATVPGTGSFTVAGWFVDQTAQGWAGADDIQVWLGTMDGGGRMLAKAQFAQSRPDVATATGNPYWAASGFAASVPGLPAGSQTLNVYAHTGGKGWWFKGVTVNGGGTGGTAAPAPSAPSAGGAPVIVVNHPTNNQNVSTRSQYTIDGTVSNASNVDAIEVWINGERNTKYASLLGSTTPLSDGSWSLTFNPTKYPSTHSNLYIYAHDRNGQETVLTREINIVDK
jgi:hypothetical protein